MTAKRLENGTRVKLGGDFSRWTDTAQRNLPGTTGTVEDYRPDYGFGADVYPAHVVRFDSPVQVNPVNTFDCAWIACENLWPLATEGGEA